MTKKKDHLWARQTAFKALIFYGYLVPAAEDQTMPLTIWNTDDTIFTSVHFNTSFLSLGKMNCGSPAFLFPFAYNISQSILFVKQNLFKGGCMVEIQNLRRCLAKKKDHL